MSHLFPAKTAVPCIDEVLGCLQLLLLLLWLLVLTPLYLDGNQQMDKRPALLYSVQQLLLDVRLCCLLVARCRLRHSCCHDHARAALLHQAGYQTCGGTRWKAGCHQQGRPGQQQDASLSPALITCTQPPARCLLRNHSIMLCIA